MVSLRKIIEKPLGEILVDRKVISRSQLKQVLDYQKQHRLLLGEAVVAMKMASEEDIVAALTCQYGFAYLPLAAYTIAPEVLNVVSGAICKEFVLIPIDKIGKTLTLAMSNPLDKQALDIVEMNTGLCVQAFVGTATEIKEAIKRYY